MKPNIKSRIFHRYLQDTRGGLLPMVAVMFPVIMGMAGLGLDVSNWMMQKETCRQPWTQPLLPAHTSF